MKTAAKILCFGVLSLTLASTFGCSKAKDDLSSLSSEDPSDPTPVTPPAVSTAKPFALKMFTTYDQVSYHYNLTFQETGTTECSVTSSAPTATCTVIVPEGRLYYSKLSFNFSWLPSQCNLMLFTPYSYKASSSASYLPPGADSAVDCTALPIPAACYGGAAVDLVPSFPKFGSLIYEPDETDLTITHSDVQTVKSAHSHLYGSNRWTVNDMATGKIGSTATSTDLGGYGDGYIANTYVNYKFQCKDHWDDPDTYTVNVVVKDEDSEAGNPTLDDHYTWKEWP